MASRETPFPRFERSQNEAGARLHMRLRPGPEAAGEGRHALDRIDDSMSNDELTELRLLVSELLSNSVRHAGAPNGWITLDVKLDSTLVRVVVTDNGPGFRQPEE